MAAPKLFFGTRGSTGFMEVDRGYLDRGIIYNLYAKTNRYAPAGAGGECVFPSLYVVVTFTQSMLLYITPIVDGASLETQVIGLNANLTSTRQTRIFELGLSVPVMLGATERGRQAPRGTWFQALVETRFNGTTDVPNQLIIEGLEVEYDVVRETIEVGVGR